MSPLSQTHSLPADTVANTTNLSAQRTAEGFELNTLTTVAADLIEYNTMRLSCQADRLITLNLESDIEPAVSELHRLGTPVFVLSGGSNVILPEILHASVLHPTYKGIEILAEIGRAHV